MGSSIVGRTITKTQDGMFCKTYLEISHDQWYRLLTVVNMLDEMFMAPKVIKIDYIRHEIWYKEITPLDCQNSSIRPKIIKLGHEIREMNNQEIIDNITELISRLHVFGFAHGDLHMENIGFEGTNFYLLDPDTMFNIKKHERWVDDLMRVGFDWEGTYEEFVEYDYKGWQTDWLEEPKKIVCE
jgi:hypothetical protein